MTSDLLFSLEVEWQQGFPCALDVEVYAVVAAVGAVETAFVVTVFGSLWSCFRLIVLAVLLIGVDAACLVLLHSLVVFMHIVGFALCLTFVGSRSCSCPKGCSSGKSYERANARPVATAYYAANGRAYERAKRAAGIFASRLLCFTLQIYLFFLISENPISLFRYRETPMLPLYWLLGCYRLSQ